MRILLTSIGRRGYLVRFFRQSIEPGDEVWGGDRSQYASGFCYCDRSVILPEVTDQSYCDILLDLCSQWDIKMLVPLIDPELEVLACRRQAFTEAGVMTVVSPLRTVQIAFDKYLTYQFGVQEGIPVPITVLTVAEALELIRQGKLSWPVVVKPRKGSASANISFCQSPAELNAAFATCPEPMIQEMMPGTEYGYDIFGDQDFRPVSVYCKQKLAMRAGETDKAISVDDPELLNLGLRLAKSLEIFGPLDVDVKLGADGKPRLLELNPRFGGGYPCSHLCGADFPRKLVQMCRGKRLVSDIGKPKPKLIMLKEDEIIRRDPEQVLAMQKNRLPSPPETMNILFTSAGRRVKLLEEFRRASNDLGIHVRIHAIDMQPLAPALRVANESAVSPPVKDVGYIDFVADYCRSHHISAIIPLIDPELPMLSAGRKQIEATGARLVLSSSEVIDTSIDKVATFEFLRSHGFKTPRLMSDGDLRAPEFPLFMKPRFGSGSFSAVKIGSLKDLEYYRQLNSELIVQEFIDGIEHTVDVFCDFDGQPLCAVPRKRIEIRGGEVSKGQVALHGRMIKETLRLVRELRGCRGMITNQCFLTRDEQVVFTEVNSRFGGGVPLSIRAGADSPRWLLELLLGRRPSIALGGVRDGVFMLRYEDAFFVPSEDILQNAAAGKK